MKNQFYCSTKKIGPLIDTQVLHEQAPEMFTCIISMLRWYSNRLNGHDISPYENQPPEIQRAMRVYKAITGEDYA